MMAFAAVIGSGSYISSVRASWAEDRQIGATEYPAILKEVLIGRVRTQYSLDHWCRTPPPADTAQLQCRIS